ncbi:mechanosensitive ion channel family protein [Agromyces sp. Leaf222]|uniref:mechanosensitive ion channel family protein n=1 Tax=Agromyces sp. Leaf222 TaxID=1735688 RepID=UPI0006F9A299|nr:mechanosensitive ion channel domain-containing protein [Agromyces sp. Leaf222]KQM82071.1 hypothetical protein ASE68_01095 [Agromyces sp. Leaf222]
MADWWSTLVINGWSIAAIVLTLLASWLLAFLARKGVRAAMLRVPSLSDGVRVLAERIVVYSIWLIGIGVALSFLGASVQPLLAIALIVSVVLVLVLRGVADNFAASVVLQARHPIALGDEITSGDFTGRVLELNGRSVVIRTPDGRTVHLPNSGLLQDPLVNASAHGARRSEVEVRVASGDQALRQRISDAAAQAHGVHGKEGVHLLPITLAGDRAVYRVQFWHHPVHGVAVTAAVVDAVASALVGAGVESVVTSVPPSPPLAPPTEV